jgi:YD repeat-containing protein
MKSRILTIVLITASIFAPVCISTANAACAPHPGSPGSNNKKPTNGSQNSSTGNDPVSMTTGAFSISAIDLQIRGASPIVFTRYFDSTIGYDGPLGYDWDFNFNRYIEYESDALYYHTGQGYKIKMTYASGTVSPGGVVATGTAPYCVTANSTSDGLGGTIITDTHGNKDTFDPAGNLVKSTNRNGNELDYTRDDQDRLVKVEDPAHGFYITLDLDTNGRITSITDSTGRTVSYTYDSTYDLTGVTYPATSDFPDGTTYQYAYDTDHRLTSETDANSNTIVSSTYGTEGTAEEFKVASQIYNGCTATLTYDDTDNKITNTDTNGFVTDYYSDGNRNLTKQVVHTAGLHSGEPSTYETDYTYDANFHKLSEADPNGNTLAWTYDSYGNMSTVTKSAPTGGTVDSTKGTQSLTAVTTYTYESRFNQVASMTDPNGNETTYDYGNATSNPPGNLLTVTYPTTAAGTATETFTYNSLGEVLTDTTPDGVTQNSYDSSTGYLTQTVRDYGTGKLNATTQFTYDTYGHVATVQDPNGNTGTITTNAQDQVTEIDGRSSEVEQRTYDANGRLIVDKKQAPSSGTWQETKSVYNSYGQLTVA